MPLEMKYFVLKPRAKTRDDAFAIASQEAMLAFADRIEAVDPELAQELRIWSGRETVRQTAEKETVDYEAALDEYRAWINDLQSGMWVNCVYCGFRYGPKETTPVSMADALKTHVEQCPKHPMSELKKRNKLLEELLIGAGLGSAKTRDGI